MDAFLNFIESYNPDLYHVLQHDHRVIESVKYLNTSTKYSKYIMIINHIKKTVVDIRLILNNGYIDAYKPILSLIPYFEYLFENSDDIKEIRLHTSVEAMSIIIDSIYDAHIKFNNQFFRSNDFVGHVHAPKIFKRTSVLFAKEIKIKS